MKYRKKDWQYFITRLLDIIWNNEIGDTLYTERDTETIKNFTKNLILMKKTFNILYDSIASIFHSTIKNLPKQIKKKYKMIYKIIICL